MIWYDSETKQPVAPGSCEDSGIPSIPQYYCYHCRIRRNIRFDKYVSGQIEVGTGRCKSCGHTLLVTA